MEQWLRAQQKRSSSFLYGAVAVVLAVGTVGLSCSDAFAADQTPLGERLIEPVGAISAPSPVAGSYIVTFKTGTSDAEQSSAIAGAGAKDISAISQLRLHVVDASEAQVSELMASSAVERVEADRVRGVQAAPGDPAYSSQWSLPRVGWDQAFGAIHPTGSAVAAILDTGVDGSHPDLAGQVIPGTSILEPGSDGTTDPNGHGTWMAGIVAAATDNGAGIAGIGYAGVKVMPVTVLGADGTGSDGNIIHGVVYAADHGADVILMSFTNPGFSQSLQDAIDYAWSKGAVVVAAAGNDESAAINYPAGDRGVVGVANSDENDALNATSNYGKDVFIAAPGTNIYTTSAGSSYGVISGTSAAAAEVAGAAALMKANSTDASNGVIVNRLGADAAPLSGGEQAGNGRLDLSRALSDTSSNSIEPAGAAPVGEGGPVVGPYVAAAKKLKVTIVGNGTVAVSDTQHPADNRSCTSSCEVSLSGNADTGTLTATPISDTFTSWSEQSAGVTGCTAAPTGGTCAFSMNNTEQAVKATFQADTTRPTTTDDVPAAYVNHNVTVTLSASDTGGSGVDKTYFTTDGSTPTTSSSVYSPSSKPELSSDGQIIKYFSTDKAGNAEGVHAATAHIDRAAPTTADNVDANWHASALVVTLTATDTGGSGVKSTFFKVYSGSTVPAKTDSGWQTYDPSKKPSLGNTQAIAYYSVDNAGNEESVKHSAAVKVDGVTGVTSGTTYTLGSVPTAVCVDPSATVSFSGKVGQVTATCTDGGGAVSVTFTVAYCATELGPPVSGSWVVSTGSCTVAQPKTAVYNVAKAGSSVPIKFSLHGNQGLAIFAQGYPLSQQILATGSYTDSTVSETTNASGLQYDASSDRYIYVWNTSKSWSGESRQLVIELGDGVTYIRANFYLK